MSRRDRSRFIGRSVSINGSWTFRASSARRTFIASRESPIRLLLLHRSDQDRHLQPSSRVPTGARVRRQQVLLSALRRSCSALDRSPPPSTHYRKDTDSVSFVN